MYFQKDYVLRMIEMMGEMIRRLCSIGRQADAFREMNEIAQRACGLPMDILRTGEVDNLRALMDEPQRYLAAQLLIVAHTIESRTRTEEELLPLLAQAVDLFSTLYDPDYTCQAADKTAQLLSHRLFSLPAQTLASAAGLMERGGRYADAEDAWHAAVEADPTYYAQAMDFYSRAELLDERELRHGRLAHVELDEGRTALRSKLKR